MAKKVTSTAAKTTAAKNTKQPFSIEMYKGATIANRAQPKDENLKYIIFDDNGIDTCHLVNMANLPKAIANSIKEE
jgi:hypothetical protein